MTAKRIKNFSSRASNQHQYDKFVEDSEFYEGVVNVKGKDPKTKLRNQKNIFRSDSSYISIDEWCHIIYGWLLLNPAMLSVSDFYEHIRDNAPFLYTLDEVIAYDGENLTWISTPFFNSNPVILTVFAAVLAEVEQVPI